MITFEIKAERMISFEYAHRRSHRRGRKTYRSWHPNGKKSYESYYINGKESRLNGPSSTYWYSHGQKWSERYCIKGEKQNSKNWNEQGELLR